MLFCQSGSNDSLPAPKNRFLSVSQLEAMINLDVAFREDVRSGGATTQRVLSYLSWWFRQPDTLAEETMESLGETSFFLALSMLSEIFDAWRRHFCRSREQGVESYATSTHLIVPNLKFEIQFQ